MSLKSMLRKAVSGNSAQLQVAQRPDAQHEAPTPVAGASGAMGQVGASGVAVNLQAIDDFLAVLAAARDDDELRRGFESYEAVYDLNVPADPDSAAYRNHQMRLYEQLHGKPYALSHEHSPMDVPSMARSPFPYVHGSAALVGDQLMGIGFLIKAMSLPKGARVLEFGPGWGNTTLALAKMGCEVVAIDVEQNFVDLIQARARMEQLDSLRAELGTFFSIEEQPASHYDAVLFYECFHHCDDHLRLMAGFDRVLKPGGIVCFASEPILDAFPLPWGLRMDGQSLWAIRRNGWMELGFNLGYFKSAMERFGWSIESKVGHDSPLSSVLIARRLQQATDRWEFSSGQLRNVVGERTRDQVAADGREGYLCFGPYVQRNAGHHEARIQVAAPENSHGLLRMDVASHGGTQVHAAQEVQLPTGAQALVLPFDLDSAVNDLEVRVWCEAGARVTLTGLSISAGKS